MTKYRWQRIFVSSLIVFTASIFTACSTSSIMNVAFLSLTVKAVDENDQPVPNAIVESSDGQRVTADSSGTAKLKFSAVGAHQITVVAQDRMPASFKITMPVDQGKTKTARLGKTVEINASVNANINFNLGGNFSALMMGQLYPILFQSMFSAYGYSMELANYSEGQWTEWKLHSDDNEPLSLHKAHLRKIENDQEWWGLYIKGKKTDDDMLMEVLFSANKDSVRRMRQKIGKDEASETPVTENWYSQPAKLTKESLQGAIKERGVNVKVAAGTFKADILEFGSPATGGKIRMWQAKEVPGGVVRTEATDENNKVIWWSELTGHGAGARTQLGSY